MTAEQLQQIETELDITLPVAYRQLMLAYPFGPDSLAADCHIPDNFRWVIEHNRYHKKHGFFGGRWAESWFLFGGDGGGNAYFMDLSVPDSPVYFADHETRMTFEDAPDFSSWLEQRGQDEEDE